MGTFERLNNTFYTVCEWLESELELDTDNQNVQYAAYAITDYILSRGYDFTIEDWYEETSPEIIDRLFSEYYEPYYEPTDLFEMEDR